MFSPPVRYSIRHYRYSPFAGMKEMAKKRGQKSNYRYSGKASSEGGRGEKEGGSEKAPLTHSTSPSGRGGVRRREGSGSRPLQSSVQDRKDAERIFPETLPSGRPAQHNTQSQQLFKYGPQNRHASGEMREAYHEQRIRERELDRLMQESAKKKMDRRFFSKFTDYTDIQDGDPYKEVFGESKTTARVRTAAWQRQFEEENKDTYLPYERDSRLKRLAPNWFVLYFVKLRDRGGADNLNLLFGVFAMSSCVLYFVVYMFYTSPSKARPIEEVR